MHKFEFHLFCALAILRSFSPRTEVNGEEQAHNIHGDSLCSPRGRRSRRSLFAMLNERNARERKREIA